MHTLKTFTLQMFVGAVMILCSNSIFAQVGKERQIEMNNGSFYEGIIFRENEDTIFLLTKENHIYALNTNRIQSINSKFNNSEDYISFLDKRKNWFITTNFLIDFDATDQLGFGAELIGGIRHHRFWQHGIGLGFKQEWGFYDYEPFTAHVSLQNRFNFRPTGSTPFLSYEPCLLIPVQNTTGTDYRYKLLGHSLEIGYRFHKPDKKRSFNLSMAALRRTGAYYKPVYLPGGGYDWELDRWLPEYKLVLKLGIQI